MGTTRKFGGWVADQDTTQATDINPQLLTYSSLGDSPKDTQEHSEGTPKAIDASPQCTSFHSSLGEPPKDAGVVIKPQRTWRKGRVGNNRYLCVLLGEKCKFMPDKSGFKICARLK